MSHLADDAEDDVLFQRTIIRNKHHVLYHFFPDRKTEPDLRQRCHMNLY